MTMQDAAAPFAQNAPMRHGDLAPVPRIAVVFATRGRPEVLDAMIARLAAQTLPPRSIVVSCTGPMDVGTAAARSDVTVLVGPPGLAAQRNTALRHVMADHDIVVFFDDDFLATADWLADVARVMAEDATVAAVTGTLMADDIKGPGFSLAEATRLVEASRPAPRRHLQDKAIPYGCNMAFRVAAITDLWFDERLIRYGWLEDRDFGSALLQRGFRSVKSSDALGVHMGIKRSRMPGRMLGYSQVVNPIYLHRKGTMSILQVVRHIYRNVLSNLAGSFRPEPYVDRRGRLIGNLIAARDILRGQIDPQLAERM